jgi:hypothetical protein
LSYGKSIATMTFSHPLSLKTNFYMHVLLY